MTDRNRPCICPRTLWRASPVSGEPSASLLSQCRLFLAVKCCTVKRSYGIYFLGEIPLAYVRYTQKSILTYICRTDLAQPGNSTEKNLMIRFSPSASYHGSHSPWVNNWALESVFLCFRDAVYALIAVLIHELLFAGGGNSSQALCS